MRKKAKAFIFGALLVLATIAAYFAGSYATAKANTTYVGSQPVKYETITINGHCIAVFKYGDDIEAVKVY